MPTDWIPEPTIVLLGCQPWPPVHRGAGCPVCGPGVREGHDSTYCGVCDSMSPRREAQIRAARVGVRARDKAEAAERSARDQLDKQEVVPTEVERRWLWNGYRGGILSPTLELTDRAKAGREWLIANGWEPDWSLALDHKGRVVGRREEPELEPA